MNTTNIEDSRGASLSDVRVSFKPADPTLVAIILPNHCLRTAPSNKEESSQTPGLREFCCRILSGGRGGVSVCVKNFVGLGTHMACTDSRVYGKHRSVLY